VSTCPTHSEGASVLPYWRQLLQRTRAALLWALFVVPLASGCVSSESCEYRCTDAQSLCPTGLSCDVKLGYCVAPGYAGTCDAQTHEVTVCANEVVKLSLPDGPSLSELEGLPNGVEINGRTIVGKFTRRASLAFGSPDETRHFVQVNTTDECPALAAPLTETWCLGERVDRVIQGAGGEGRLRFELLTEESEFELTKDGRLTGVASQLGSRQLEIAITDARGVQRTELLDISVSNECPDVSRALPKSCAAFEYEAPLTLVGKAPVELLDFTPTYRDGQALSAKQAADVARLLKAKPVRQGDDYLLQAAPSEDAEGSYVFSVKLKNTLSVEQRDIPFAVRSCDAVKADFSVCADKEFDEDLAGDKGDVWQFYDPADPLFQTRLQFVGERRIRGKLPASREPYRVQARVRNAVLDTERLVTLELLSADCSANTDAGTTTPTDETSAPNGEETSETDAGVTPPPPPPATPQIVGCKGDYLSVFPDMNLTATGWSVSGSLPPGLTLNPSTGAIKGTPTAADITNVVINSSFPSQSKQHQITISDSCLFGYKSIASGQQQLFVGHILRAPNDLVQVDLDTPSEDVDLFSFDTTGTKIALSTQGYDPSVDGGIVHRLYVATIAPSSNPPVPDVTSTLLGNFGAAAIRELAWSNNGQLAVLVDQSSVSNVPVDDNLRIFTYAGSTWNAVARSAETPRGLTWMDDAACVASAVVWTNSSQTAKARGSVCWFPDGSLQKTQGVDSPFSEASVSRTSTASLLTVTPMITEVVNTIDVRSIRVQSEVANAQTHAGAFASPKGDMLAIDRGSSGLELARPGDPTQFDPAEYGLYTPIALIEDCNSVTAWSRSSGHLACTKPSSDQVKLVLFPNETPDETFTTTISSHLSHGQRTFVGESYYVFDARSGTLKTIKLQTPPQVQTLSLSTSQAAAMALLALPDLRIAVQVDGKLLIVDLTTNQVVREVYLPTNSNTQLLDVQDCTERFGFVGFENWCGGDTLSRAFQASKDAASFLLLAKDGTLRLSTPVHTVSIAPVACGDRLDCSGEFTFARPRHPN
jgi:hypothetical protein